MMKKVLLKWKSMSAAKKASFALIFSKFCQKGISMISTPIFTRIMSTEQYGIISNFLSWQNILLIIGTLNLSQGVFNNGMLEFKEDRERFTLSMLILANITTTIFFVIYLLFYKEISPILNLSIPLMILMLLYLYFYPAYSYWSCRQRYEYKYILQTVLTILISIFQVVVGVLLVINCDANSQAFYKLLASEMVLIVVGVILYIGILIKSKLKISLKYIVYGFKFNIYLVPHFLAMTVLSSGDKIMITSIVGEKETAIYAVSYTAASVILIFWQSIEASWTPWLYEHLSANNVHPIKKRANQIISAFALLAVMCMLFAPEIMGILASNQYMEGVYIIPSVTAGVFFMALYALYMRVEYYSKNTKATMIGSIFAAIINVLLNYIFINIFGYIAAGYTTLACYVILSLYHYIYCKKLGLHKVYDNKYFFKLSIFIILVSFIVSICYKITVLRYMIIIILLVVCIQNRKKIISICKEYF